MLMFLVNMTCIYHDFTENFISWIQYAALTSMVYVCLLALSALTAYLIRLVKNLFNPK